MAKPRSILAPLFAAALAVACVGDDGRASGEDAPGGPARPWPGPLGPEAGREGEGPAAPDASACLDGCAGVDGTAAPLWAAVARAGRGAQEIVLDADWPGFVAAWQDRSGRGLRLVDLDTRLAGTTRRYTGVFHAGHDAHALWVGDTWAGFERTWRELSAEGLRLVDLEVYRERDGALRFAGVFREGADGYYLWVGVDWDGLVATWDDLAARGLRLVDLEVYAQGDGLRYAGVWRQGTTGHALWAGVSWDAFAAQTQRFAAQGLRLVDLEAYAVDGRRQYAGVWRAGEHADHLVAASSEPVFRAQVAALTAAGQRIVRIEHDPGGANAPPAWAAIFHRRLEGRAIGWSFAVAEPGIPTTAGGEGWARAPWEHSSPSVPATADGRMQLASLSKPITATAILRLVQEGRVALDAPFVRYVGGRLPDRAPGVDRVTVRHLLTHRSGMYSWGYCGPDLWASLDTLVRRPLVGTPGSAVRYSNGNFCLLRAIVDVVTGQGYERWVQETILAPMGITQLSCRPDAVAPTAYYALGALAPGVTWTEDYGGHCGAYGWYGSSADLGRFLVGLRVGRVLAPATLATMLTGGLGWWKASVSGGSAYVHDGAWFGGDGRGVNGAVALLPGGGHAVLLVNTNGIVDGGDTFRTIDTLLEGWHALAPP